MSGYWSQSDDGSLLPESQIRPVGGTEYSWCKAVPVGTGVTVLALLLAKPVDSSLLLSALRRLQDSRPILRSKLHFDAATASFSFLTPPHSDLGISAFDLESTARILEGSGQLDGPAPSRFNLILEHEMGRNTWRDVDHSSDRDWDLLHASVYSLEEARWVVVVRVHTAACDRAAATAVMKELLPLLLVDGGGAATNGIDGEEKKGVNAEIEKLIPAGKAVKPFWARGVNLLGYSLNSLRMSNIDFIDPTSPRISQVVRLQMNSDNTRRLLTGCESRGIKLCGALAAAALIAAHSSKNLPANKWEKYAVVTLTNCRPILDPPLPSNSAGFYHSAILNSHDICRGEKLWELAQRTYASFADAKDNSKHFSDMGDLNFLMCRAIENPGLTPSASMRTAFISVFEDSVIDESSPLQQEIRLEDYMICSSVHGVGPSIALFNTVRNGQLDCACVYPSPLHSREQIAGLVNEIMRILINCDESVN
ncbi:hypothetical protein SAY87_022714 [Trapa incisa]|uniref:Condensation domain-containing protein n=1 Tax=Trapa incisa TaxID=236973 RepID=A0AAN7K1C7_9MYRT|nr:hypothetical protein SAY87_022714 [Trapa incisa]